MRDSDLPASEFKSYKFLMDDDCGIDLSPRAPLRAEYFPPPVLQPGLSGTKLTAAYTQRLWAYEGRCPKCGEVGRLDPCGGAVCTKHGVYQMQLVPKPEPEFEAATTPPMTCFPFDQPIPNVQEGRDTHYYSELLFGTPQPFPAMPNSRHRRKAQTPPAKESKNVSALDVSALDHALAQLEQVHHRVGLWETLPNWFSVLQVVSK